MLLEWDHEDAEAFASLGHIHMLRGDDDKAYQFLRKALEMQPSNGGFHLLMAQALSKAAKVSRAVVHARKATRLLPQNAQAHLLLGDLLFQRGMKSAAGEAWDKAVSLDPELACGIQERLERRQSQAE